MIDLDTNVVSEAMKPDSTVLDRVIAASYALVVASE